MCVYFIFSLSSNSASQALSTSYQVFTNETNYPPDARRAACERVCIPLLKSCSEVSLRDFYLEHTREMMEVIEAKISKVISLVPSLHPLSTLHCTFNFRRAESRWSLGTRLHIKSWIFLHVLLSCN